MNRLGIDMLTVLAMPPVEHVKLAAELGCVSISTGLANIPWEMFGITDFALYAPWNLREPALRRELTATLRDTGVVIALGEGIVLDGNRRPDDFDHDLDLMAEIGAQRINGVGMDPEPERCREDLVQLAEMTAARGMHFTMEFCPVFTIATLDTTLALVDTIGRERSSVLIDTMHFFRSGGTLEQLRALDPALIGYVQLADCHMGPVGEDYMAEAMFARELPGRGNLPLAEFIAALPTDLPVSVEIPRFDEVMGGLSLRDHARRVIEATRAAGA